MNLYAYVHNDPINLFDPDGKESRQVMQQEANTKDFLKGKITREEAQKNSYEIAGGDVGKAIVENLTPMGLYMDVAESLAQGDAPVDWHPNRSTHLRRNGSTLNRHFRPQTE